MSSLTSSPAFGFESPNFNAHYEIMFRENRKKVHPNWKEAPEEWMKIGSNNYRIASNISKVLGYVPIIGMIVGIARISFGLHQSKAGLTNKPNHVIRGLVEMANLGALLLMPDLILTGYREKMADISFSSFFRGIKKITPWTK